MYFSWGKIKQNRNIENIRKSMDESIVILYTVDREGFRDKIKFEQRPEKNKGAINADSRGRECYAKGAVYTKAEFLFKEGREPVGWVCDIQWYRTLGMTCVSIVSWLFDS